ncbi:hypothetical protein JCM8547_003020, partial [Rhodosporidiobolus lusitaniae]
SDGRASSGSGGGEASFPRSTLPNELVDQIFAELAKPELASCCRVNRVFLNLARPHLYRVVQFKCLAATSLGGKRLVTTPGSDGIYRLLHNRPQLASLVRSVAVELEVCPPETAFEVWEADYPTSLPKLGHNDISLNDVPDLWLKAHELDMRLLLAYLPKVQAATFLEHEPWDASDGWSHGPLWNQPVYLPSLTSLTVSEFDPAILGSFPLLHSLECTFNFRYVEINATGLSNLASPTLSNLVLHFSPQEFAGQRERDAFDWLISRSQTTLVSLETFWDIGFHPSLGGFTALRHLSLIFENIDHDLWSMPAPLLHLSSLPPSLVSLSVDDRHNEGHEIVDLSSSFLAMLPPLLEELSLNTGAFRSGLILPFTAGVKKLAPALK